MNGETSSQPVTFAADIESGSALKWFVSSAGVILGLTGVAKVWSAFGDVKLLTVVDPIVGLEFKHLMLGVGMVEIAIALVCFFGKRQTLAIGLVAWLATNFLVYRLGLWWLDWKKPCGCLGNITGVLHISPQTADSMVKMLLAYLLIGSYGLLIWEWKHRQKQARALSRGSTFTLSDAVD
ncbi:MAG: hypothetical protein IH623_06975 [Verrucomicrobia bacterium]|nr:hypothetical protein [Verrucomicrobiota bacterium]